jgi:hypothetical protein
MSCRGISMIGCEREIAQRRAMIDEEDGSLIFFIVLS